MQHEHVHFLSNTFCLDLLLLSQGLAETPDLL